MVEVEKSKGSWTECSKTIERRWHVPFVFVEWICWRVSPFLEQLAFLRILEYLGRLAVVVAVIVFLAERADRQRAKHYHAWQVISSAQGKQGSNGRMDALQDLNQDRVSLAGVDISKAFLSHLNLEHADLTGADFAEAKLMDANLTKARLTGADLTGADLLRTKLSGANLFRANLIRANLLFADLSGAGIEYANLCNAMLARSKLVGATLLGANLTGANLRDANLCETNLRDTNLSGANLMYADLTDVKHWQQIKSIEHANIYGINNAPEGFIEWATAPGQGAVSIEDEHEWKTSASKDEQEAGQE